METEKKENKEKSSGDRPPILNSPYLAFVKRDMLYLTIIVFCLGAVMYDLMTIDKYVDKADKNCNDYLRTYCACQYEPIHRDLLGAVINGTENIDLYANGTG